MTDLTKDWLDEVLVKLYNMGRADATTRIIDVDTMPIDEAKQAITDKLREARIEEIEYGAAKRAYDAGLGASEYEAFLTSYEKDRIAELRGKP